MRAGRVVVLAALVVCLMAAPAYATPHFSVGQGRNPGVAIDAAGTAYIGCAARISLSRSRVERRGRWTLLVDLRRSRAKRTATVRLVPRHGRARTLRLPVRGCGRVA